MMYLNLTLSELRSPEAVGSDPITRATWVWLLAHCVEQENSGTIHQCKDWGDRRWMQTCGVTAAEVNSPSELWEWDGDDLHVRFYPNKQQEKVQRMRDIGSKGGTKRWSKEKANAIPDAIPNANRKRKEKKRKEIKKRAYRTFAHLSLSHEEFEKLRGKWSKDQIDHILDQIENFANNKKYSSLYLTANNWLKKEYPEGKPDPMAGMPPGFMMSE